VSRRRPSLPGVEKDVEALLNGSGGSAPATPPREPPFGEDRPLPADHPPAATPELRTATYRSALSALASQFPSAAPPAKPEEATIPPSLPTTAAAAPEPAPAAPASSPAAGSQASPPVPPMEAATEQTAPTAPTPAGPAPEAPAPAAVPDPVSMLEPPPSAKPQEAPIEPTPSTPAGAPAQSAADKPAAIAPAAPEPPPPGIIPYVVDALYGNNDGKRWSVIGGALAIALVIVVAADAIRPPRAAPPPAPPPVAVAPAPAAPVAAPAPPPPPVVVETPAMRAERAALAALRLQGQAVAGRPFATELTALKRSAGDGGPYAAVLGRIEPLSAGIAPLGDLAGQFAADTQRALALALAAEPPREGMLAKMGGLLNRKPTLEETTRAVLVRAQAALDSGDYGAALREAGQVAAAPAEAIEPWIAAVKKRLALEDALRELMAVASQTIAAGT